LSGPIEDGYGLCFGAGAVAFDGLARWIFRPVVLVLGGGLGCEVGRCSSGMASARMSLASNVFGYLAMIFS